MFRALQRWLDDVPISEPIMRRQAILLQAMFVIILLGCVIGLIAVPIGMGSLPLNFLLGYGPILIMVSCAFFLLRRGYFQVAVYSVALTMVVSIGFTFLRQDITQSVSTALALTLPMVLAGFTLGRRGLFVLFIVNVALVFISYVLRSMSLLPPPDLFPLAQNVVSDFILLTSVMAFMIDQFGRALQHTLEESVQQRQELEAIRNSLEDIVEQRTASLQQALSSVEQREASLQSALQDLRTSQTIIQQLSFPILPVLPKVLLAPLVGSLDGQRIQAFSYELLQATTRERARAVVLDVTATAVIDTYIARQLLDLQATLQLLGAQVVLVGVRPELAQTLVALSIDLGQTRIFSDLREAISVLAEQS